eukprot:scaffold40753_cov176-Amphora_coffeaeformis.AAC.1
MEDSAKFREAGYLGSAHLGARFNGMAKTCIQKWCCNGGLAFLTSFQKIHRQFMLRLWNRTTEMMFIEGIQV